MDTTAVKSALELLRKGATIKDQEQILSLRTVIMDLREEILELRDINRELKSKLKTAENFTFREPFYYAEGDNVPHCSNCWEADKKAIHVKNLGKRIFQCPQCKGVYRA